jgi:5-methylcytosine-specific restriction endonuclease McrA
LTDTTIFHFPFTLFQNTTVHPVHSLPDAPSEVACPSSPESQLTESTRHDSQQHSPVSGFNSPVLASSFESLSQLHYHECAVCGRRCRDLRSLHQHRRHHVKPYSCDHGCGKYFSTKRDRLRHVHSTHPTKADAQQRAAALRTCSVCRKSFTRADNLQRHLRIHLL